MVQNYPRKKQKKVAEHAPPAKVEDDKKGQKRSLGFFEDLSEEGDVGYKPKPKKKKTEVPSWGKGTGHHLKKYVKVKELVDIESTIQKYLKENKIEIIDGDIANKKTDNYKNDVMLRLKGSEIQRIERIKQAEENNVKTPQELEMEEYFRDSLKIDMTKTFESMHLEKSVMRAINDLKFTTPTPIQAATVPVALQGKDVCGCAATGTGKTAAYMLPIIDRLVCAGKPITPVTRVMIIVPTRELGVQVFQVGQSLAKYTNVKFALVCGGLNAKMQEREVLSRPDIIIATPGRLMTFLKDLESFTLDHVEIMVLDEADRVLDEYFADQMGAVIERCSKQRQTLLFSATMTTEVKKVATAALNDPIKIFVNSNTDVAKGLRQEYVLMKDDSQHTKIATLAYLLINVFNNNTLVFLPTKILCHRMYVILRLMGLKVGELHSKMPQSARLHNLALFSQSQIRVLLCTDLAARGLDIRGVDTVINYQLNKSYEMYVHRVGRTARAGKTGLAVTLVPDKDYKMLKVIKRSSKTMMYERKVAKGDIDVWKPKMEKLQELCTIILEKEKEMVRAGTEEEIQRQIENVKYKAEKQMERTEKFIKKTKFKSQLAEDARSQGLSIKDYLRMKRLNSNAVSNSKKKRVLRYRERNESALFSKNKKGLASGEGAVPSAMNDLVLKKRVNRQPGVILPKKK